MADKRRRSCFCICLLWTTMLILILLLLAAIAGGIFWAIYHPHRPNFTITSLRLTRFRLTSTNLDSRLNFNVISHNPNKKITFFYEPFKIFAYSNNVEIGNGSLPGFRNGPKSTNMFPAVVSGSGRSLGIEEFSSIRSDLKRNMNSLPLKIVIDSEVKVKIGSLKTKKFGMRISCDGAGVSISGKLGKISDIKCKVKLRIKLWKWTL